MSDTIEDQRDKRPRLLVNLGAGQKDTARLPAMFADWREVRVDVDAVVAPDILATMTDLSAIESGRSCDASTHGPRTHSSGDPPPTRYEPTETG